MSSYEIPPSMAEANKWLRGMLGSNELVSRWWNSPNKHFDGETPLNVWSVPNGAQRVMKYIIYHYDRS